MERLEFIAKAMGASYKWDEAGQALWIDVSEANPRGRDFKPETNDADCFRAMVDGGLCVRKNNKFVTIYRSLTDVDIWQTVSNTEQFKDHPDKEAATRKAIFDCLEQVGRAMSEES